MIQAAIISNGITGLDHFFRSNDHVNYRMEPITSRFDPDFSGDDLVIVPNGSDHIAMLRIRDRIRDLLESGRGVMCFDGWFTDWVPGNRWVMDNQKPTRDVRYRVRTDRHGLFDGVDVDHLTFSHGISGWWACGYIEPHPDADVLLEDTWGRAVIVLDEVSTPGTMILTASGPLGDASFDDNPNDLRKLYHNFLTFISRKGVSHEANRTAV